MMTIEIREEQYVGNDHFFLISEFERNFMVIYWPTKIMSKRLRKEDDSILLNFYESRLI